MPERLIVTSSAFEDENGNARLEVLNSVTFAEHTGKTKLTLHAVVVKSSSEVAGALDGMEARSSRRPLLLEIVFKEK